MLTWPSKRVTECLYQTTPLVVPPCPFYRGYWPHHYATGTDSGGVSVVASIELSESYSTRPIRFLELAEQDGWRVKVYGISIHDTIPEPSLVEAAIDHAFDQLPTPATADDRHGAAILIVHEAREGNFVLLDWWFGENMLKHHLYFSPYDDPYRFEDISDTRTMACVWELRVFSFERDAWIDTVLANESGPDLDAYLAREFNDDV